MKGVEQRGNFVNDPLMKVSVYFSLVKLSLSRTLCLS